MADKKMCPMCAGSGDDFDPELDCGWCQGTGVVNEGEADPDTVNS